MSEKHGKQGRTPEGRNMDPIQTQRLQALRPWGRRWEVLMSNLDIDRANNLTAECAEFLCGGLADLMSAPIEDVGLPPGVATQLRELYEIETVRDWCSTTLEELEELRDLRWICQVYEMVLLFIAERLDSASKGSLES